MGIFDRWRKRPAPPATPPATPPVTSPAEPDGFVVPEGHRLFLYRPPPSTSLISTQAIAWLAHIGSRSEKEDQELDDILERVDALLRGGRIPILLCDQAGRLSDLMAPSNPQVRAYPHGMLVWTVDVAGLAGATRAPSLVQRWLRCIHTHAAGRTPPIQCVFLPETASPQARAVAALVRGLGIAVRVTSAEQTAVLAEVQRPEGVVLAALLGTSVGPAYPADRFALEINQAKDRAQQDGDAARLERLEAEELDALGTRLATAEAPVFPVERAPRMRRLLLAVADDGAPAVPALFEELLRREVPLTVLVDAKTRGGNLRTWPGGLPALSVFSDEASLLTTARDLGLQLGTFASWIMPSPKLFGWAAEHSWAIAMNVYRARDRPVYVVVSSEAVKALARGTMPAGSASWPSTVESSTSDDVAVRYTYGPNEDIDAVFRSLPPASAHTVDLYAPMTGLMAVIVEVMIASKPRSGTPTFVTTFRLPSGAELQKPWQGATAAEAEFSRAVLTVPLGARHVSTALRV